MTGCAPEKQLETEFIIAADTCICHGNSTDDYPQKVTLTIHPVVFHPSQ